MDDWFTIVLALIFFGLPFLEGVLKKSKRRQQGQGGLPDTAHPELPPRDQVGSALPSGASDSFDDSSWSDGWGTWPGEGLEEELESERVPSSWSTTEAPDRTGVEARKPEVIRVPVEAEARIPDLVTLPEIGQTRVPQRIQGLAERLDKVAQADTSPRPAPSPTVSPKPIRVQAAVSKRRLGKAAALLDNRAGVRRAIIVSELLGPPVSLRDRPRD